MVGEVVDRHQVGEVGQEQADREVVDQAEADQVAFQGQVELEGQEVLVVPVDQEEVRPVLNLEPIQLLSFLSNHHLLDFDLAVVKLFLILIFRFLFSIHSFHSYSFQLHELKKSEF